jgi:L-cystine uptake protein TcyP (sodium:dicarboxylate symporter family)
MLQKDVGLFNLMQAIDGLEAYSMRLFTTILNWTPEEVKVLCAKVRAELKSKSAHRIMDL